MDTYSHIFNVHMHVCVEECISVLSILHWPVADPTISLEGDSDIASASLSRRPSSLASAEPTLCRGTPKLSGQLPHTSSRVTPRPSNGPANKKQTQITNLSQQLLLTLSNNKVIRRVGANPEPIYGAWSISDHSVSNSGSFNFHNDMNWVEVVSVYTVVTDGSVSSSSDMC